tara:strand:- start:158 stop:280 length:123 start_codon:yes stop_codon:yes gene_type:complete
MDVPVTIESPLANDRDATPEFWKGAVETSSTNFAIFGGGR